MESTAGETSNQERLEQIIADYLHAAQSGSGPDGDELVKPSALSSEVCLWGA